MVSFCVVIVNFHGYDETIRCVDSIIASAQGASAAVKIVIVENSDDQFDPDDSRYTVFRTGHNVGLAGAWYIGFYSDVCQACDYVIFLNNDTKVADDFIDRLKEGVSRWGPNCAFGPRISYSEEPNRIWSRGGEIRRFPVRVVHHGEGTNGAELKPNDFETGHLSGCCLIVRVAHLNSIGGPDTNFFFRGEEWDINYRLRSAGVKLVLLDHAGVSHDVNGSHNRYSPLMLYYAYRAKVLFAKKILPWWYFPIWFVAGMIFSAVIAPRRFAGASGGDIPRIRKALLAAFAHGMATNKILPPADTTL